VAKLFVQAQATSNRSEYVFVQDSASTTGGGKTGIAYNAASFTAYYVRPAGSATAITLATQTVTGAWSSGGWVEVDATNLPGIYRFDIPNAVFATGVDHAVVMLKGASGMAPVSLEYQLTGFNPSTAWLTSAQTASAVWGASVAGYNTATDFGGVVNETRNVVGSTEQYVLDVPNQVWEELRSGHTTVGTFGQYVNAELVTPVTSAALVRMGPFEVRADGLGASDPLDIQKGAQHGIDVQCVDNNGAGIDITSATVTAKVYNSGATLVDTYSCTATYAADGRAQFTIDTTVTNTPGTYTATITRTTGASDTQVFGPLRIYVRDI
jgi:hypothetical protein